jgi:hypothetical protein
MTLIRLALVGGLALFGLRTAGVMSTPTGRCVATQQPNVLWGHEVGFWTGVRCAGAR